MRWLTLIYGRTALTLASLLVTLGCDRTPETTAKSAPPSPPIEIAPTASTASVTPAALSSFRLPASARVVAIGDIHGDLKALRATLRLVGAIDSEDGWIGKNLTVVQTGDQVDRGDQDREVLDVLEKLEGEARAAGGALHVLLGNHELMQPTFDFRYVTQRSFESFGDLSSHAPSFPERVSPEQRGRAVAFAPGGPYARKLAQHLTVALVGDTLFAHGGVLPAHIDYGLARINSEASSYLLGKRAALPRVLASDDSPVWTREYGSPEVEPASCELLGRVLKEVGAKRLVVGHTVQKDGISAACQDRLFRIDVGLSAYYGQKQVQALEITAQGARVLEAAGKSAPRDSAVQSAP